MICVLETLEGLTLRSESCGEWSLARKVRGEFTRHGAFGMEALLKLQQKWSRWSLEWLLSSLDGQYWYQWHFKADFGCDPLFGDMIGFHKLAPGMWLCANTIWTGARQVTVSGSPVADSFPTAAFEDTFSLSEMLRNCNMFLIFHQELINFKSLPYFKAGHTKKSLRHSSMKRYGPSI